MLVKVPLYLILSNLLFPFFFAFLDFLYSNFCCWRFLNCLTTMEALSSSTILSKLPKTNHLVPETPQFSIRPCNKRVGYLKIDESFNLSLGISNSERVGISGSKILAVSKDVSGETEENPGSENGRGLVSDESHTLAEANPDLKPNMKKVFDDTSKPAAPITAGLVSGTGGGTRAGLFRTPISGGVQSATSAHDLPRPALAVRNLMEQARFAHLCTVMSRMHHRRQGYPFGSLVDFAPDSMGHPIFSFSPLAIHTRNLLADPRCTLVVQIPGWSGLSNARVTIFGDVFPLPEDQQEWAHKQYIRKHQQGPSQQWGNFHYFRMQNISDIYFIGGFGTVAWVDVNEYENLKPDKIAVEGGEQYLKELNAIFSKPLRELLSTEVEVDDAALISIDSKGTDVRVRQGAQFNIQRISFEEGHAVETLEQAKAALQKLISKGRVYNLQK